MHAGDGDGEAMGEVEAVEEGEKEVMWNGWIAFVAVGYLVWVVLWRW